MAMAFCRDGQRRANGSRDGQGRHELPAHSGAHLAHLQTAARRLAADGDVLNKEVQQAAAMAQLKLDRQRLFHHQLKQHLESKQQQQLLRRETKHSRCVGSVSAV